MRNLWLLLGLALVVAHGCSRRDPASTPPEVRYGEDQCAECAMIINESRYAAALVTSDGETLLFDDAGELGPHAGKLAKPPLAVWVRDYRRPSEEAWLRGENAAFVHSRKLKTPMGFGLVAVRSDDEARKLAAATHGRVLTLEGVLAATELLP